MKRPTRILAWAGAVIALLLVLLLVLPFLFRGQIETRVKTAVNQNLNARVDWRDVGLGFFRHFPDLTLTLDDLTAAGVGKFQGDTLAAVRHFRVSLSLPSVLSNAMGGSGPVVVHTVELDQPRLRLIALEDGSANWDITKKTPETPPGTGVEADGREPPAARDHRRRRGLRQPPVQAQGVDRRASTSPCRATSARISWRSRPRRTPTR